MCFDSDDYWDCMTVTTSKARKPHRCSDCCEPIEAGQFYKLTTGKFDGDWTKHKSCGQCELARWLIHVQELADGCRWGESWCMVEVREAAREYEINWPSVDEGQRFLLWKQRRDELERELLTEKMLCKS